MAQPHVLEGTGEELQRMLAQFPHERFRLVPLPQTETTIDKNSAEQEDSLLGRINQRSGVRFRLHVRKGSTASSP